MKVDATWTGALPRIGDYLLSSHRPRFAYRVVAFEKDNHVEWDGEVKSSRYKLAITVDKVGLRDVPDDATVHPWKWSPRGPKKLMEVRYGG